MRARTQNRAGKLRVIHMSNTYLLIAHRDPRCIRKFFNLSKSKSKADKIEGVKKHKELERAKKKATKERKAVALPAGYKRKK